MASKQYFQTHFKTLYTKTSPKIQQPKTCDILNSG
jgi:hypothetical protein